MVFQDSEAALTYFKESWREIDLVILDLIMLKLSGRDAFAAMKAINPNVKVVVSSGYSMKGEAQAVLDEGAIGFLQKPFRKADLVNKVIKSLHEDNTNVH